MFDPNPNYASLCFLSYNRPNFIGDAIMTAVENAGYPCEVIVHDDGSSDPVVRATLTTLLDQGKISHLILNPAGHNEGVGTAIKRMFAIATGDPVIKIDQDMLFEPDWLARTVGILRQDHSVGMLGIFKYHHPPVVWSEQKIDVPTEGGYHYTRQFCGSVFAIPRDVWLQHGAHFKEHLDAFNEDSDFMERLRFHNYELALPDVDLATNRGFGIGPSTVVEEGYVVHKINHRPHVLNEITLSAPEEGETEKRPPLQNGLISDLIIDEPGPFEYDWTLPPEVISGAMAATREFDRSARKFDVGVVITTCAGREENLRRTIANLRALEGVKPRKVIVVFDGCPMDTEIMDPTNLWIEAVVTPKHEPGLEQPRNAGFNALRVCGMECNYVWFLDSDLVFPPDTLRFFYEGLCAAEDDRILIGPYDWMMPGETEPHGKQGMADPRWVSFNQYTPAEVLRYDMGAGLANFGGNLIWPVDAFDWIGGFHIDLHHGRCEDGELGLRACERGVPMSFVRDARAWHVHHAVNMDRNLRANERDVPLLNAMHPWVEQQGLIVVDKDGKRFDWRCPTCGEICNSLAYWPHAQIHNQEALAA